MPKKQVQKSILSHLFIIFAIGMLSLIHILDARWNYSSRGWETYMAEKGYLLFILDNRGSENQMCIRDRGYAS